MVEVVYDSQENRLACPLCGELLDHELECPSCGVSLQYVPLNVIVHI